MREAFRYLFLLVIALFVLSFSKFTTIQTKQKKESFILDLVQCRSTLPETMNQEKRLLRNMDYINMCMFRKTRLCDCKLLIKNQIFIRDIFRSSRNG